MEKTISIMYSSQKNTEQQLDKVIPILVDKIIASQRMTEEYLQEKDYTFRMYLSFRKPTNEDIFMVMKNLYNDLTKIQYRLTKILNTSPHNSYEIYEDFIQNNGASLHGVPQYTLSNIKLYDKHSDCLQVSFIPYSTRTNVVIINDKILTDIFIDIINKRNEIMKCE